MSESPTMMQLHQAIQDNKKDADEKFVQVDEKFEQGTAQMNQLHTEVCANTVAMESVKDSLDAFSSLWTAGTGAFKVGKWFGKFIIFCGAVALGVTAIITALHMGDKGS